jgi:hypothetical protein
MLIYFNILEIFLSRMVIPIIEMPYIEVENPCRPEAK